MQHPFFLLILKAGMLKNKNLYNYNMVYPADQGASIQYFSNRTPEKFWTQIGGKFLQDFEYTKSRINYFLNPSGHYIMKDSQDFLDSYGAFTRELESEDERIEIKSITINRQAACVEELRHAGRGRAVSISSILDGRLAQCKINLMIELIHSGQIRIRKSESDCTYDPQIPCIIADKTVPILTIADDFRILASARSQGKKAYLITVAGTLKVILQQSEKQHIIIPRLGDQQSNAIYEFLVMLSKHRVPSDPVLQQSDVVDLYTSATSDAALLYRYFI
ncbi:putative secreted effector protein, partial [Blumeria graminis f. sp. tritici 96224]